MVTLFSTGCPKCRVLEQKLNNKQIEYSKDSNMDEIINQGFMSAPVLKVNDVYLDFTSAVKWVNNQTIMDFDCDSCKL
jgi:hypothetical protein